jgi:hypothetical protein
MNHLKDNIPEGRPVTIYLPQEVDVAVSLMVDDLIERKQIYELRAVTALDRVEVREMLFGQMCVSLMLSKLEQILEPPEIRDQIRQLLQTLHERRANLARV